MEAYDIAQERLSRVRDLFAFCCYTGLAYHEMRALRKEHIIKGFDGLPWISMNRHKTSGQLNIPLLHQAEAYLEKLDFEEHGKLPEISNQKMNSYLKEIAAITGIDKPITHHWARKTFASSVLLYHDVPMEVVSELLGHSSMKITQDYYGKIVNQTISRSMRELSTKLTSNHKENH